MVGPSIVEAAAASGFVIKALEKAGLSEQAATHAGVALTVAYLVAQQAAVKHPQFLGAGLRGFYLSAGAAAALVAVDRASVGAKKVAAKVKTVRLPHVKVEQAPPTA